MSVCARRTSFHSMTRRVALVSCVKTKRSSPARAEDLYTSALFWGLKGYAKALADEWYILSAEHGLLRPETEIAPYERTLNGMPAADARAWAQRVQRQLIEVLPRDAEVVVLAGSNYRREIVPFLRSHGFT